jgi:hypothetical protein
MLAYTLTLQCWLAAFQADGASLTQAVPLLCHIQPLGSFDTDWNLLPQVDVWQSDVQHLVF